ncbi:MAG: PilZ domain-containing protein [Thermodesulfobacteriota bacterium]
MNGENSWLNRRKFPRFKAGDDLFILHGGFGKIVDIGMGGVAFIYVEKEKPRNGATCQGALFSREDDYLVELPFRTISDTVVRRSPSGRMNIRKRVVVYEELSDEQLEELERFLLDNLPLPTRPDRSLP